MSSRRRPKPPVRGGGLNACRALRTDATWGAPVAGQPDAWCVESDSETEQLALALASSVRAHELHNAEMEAVQQAMRLSAGRSEPAPLAEHEAIEIALAISSADVARNVTPPPPVRAAWTCAGSGDDSSTPESELEGGLAPDDGLVLVDEAHIPSTLDDCAPADVHAIEEEGSDDASDESDNSDHDWVLC